MNDDLIRKLQRDIELFRKDFDNAMQRFDERFDRITKDIGEVEKYIANEIKPNTNSWNKTTQNADKVIWIIITAVIISLLAVIGLG